MYVINYIGLFAARRGEQRLEQVARDIRRYVAVSVATVFVVTVMGIVDSLIAGRMIGELALAVTGLSLPVFLFFNMITAIFSIGGSITAAQALGAGDRGRASLAASVTLCASLCFCAAAALALFIFSRRIAALLGASSQVLEMTAGYVKGSAFTLVAMLPSQCLCSLARVDGRPWLSLRMMLLVTLFNALLDYTFIRAGAGMFGVALATGLSYLLAAGSLLKYYLSASCSYQFVNPLRGLALLGVIVSTGLPNSLNFLWMTINSLAVNRLLASLGGLAALTACSVMNNTDLFMSFAIMGPCFSLTTLMSIYYGKKDAAAIRFIAKRVVTCGLALTALLSCVIFAAPAVVAGFFGVKDAAALFDCAAALRWLSFAVLVRQFSNFLLYYYQSTRHVALANAVTFLRCLGIFAIVIVPLVKCFGINGVWCVSAVGHTLTVLLAAAWAVRTSRRKRKNSDLLDSVLMLPDDFKKA